ncbi:MAG: hypothetical protein IJ542_00815 [Clostridia bacterium]|nr:hypothetical protein [Clostridia bacterium]
MAKTLKDLMNQNYAIDTCGTNSLILKKSDYAYKITREFSVEEAREAMKEINYLSESHVAIPRVFSVEEVAFANNSDFNNAISRVLSMPGRKANWQALGDIASHDINKNPYILPMLQSQYVEGINLFSDKRLRGIELINKNKCFQNCEQLHPKIMAMLKESLVPNLELLEEMSNSEIYKFLKDGFVILNSGKSIDNLTCENFIYGKVDGVKAIYYIDIGGLEAMSSRDDFGEKNLFRFTVDNMCKMIYVNTIADLGDLRPRQTRILNRISETVKTFLAQNVQSQEQFDEYMRGSNYLKKLRTSLMNEPDQSQIQPN